MRKSIKKAIALVCAFTMAVAGISFAPAKDASADDGTWSIVEPTLVTYTVNGSKVYGIDNLVFTAYQGSAAGDYAYGAYVDSISEDNLVRNYSADWLWGIGAGGNNLHYDGVVTNKTKTTYFTPGSTHTFIVAVYDLADFTTPLDTVSIEIDFPAGEIETTVEDRIRADMVSPEKNIAMGKMPICSSSVGAYKADKAFDDSLQGDSRWAAASYDAGEYLGVNLGAVYTIDRVALLWEPAFATDYDIEVSTDGVNFTSIKNHKPNTAELVEFDFTGIQAQFVRILCNANALPYGFSIYGMGVYGEYVSEGIEVETTTEAPILDGDDLIPAKKKNSGELNVPAFTSTSGAVEYSYEYKVEGIKISEEKWYVARYTVTSDVDKWFELRLQDALSDYVDYSGIGLPKVFVPAGETKTVTEVFKGQRNTEGGIFDICMGYINGTDCDEAKVSVTNASLKVFSSEEDANAEAAKVIEEETTTEEESTVEATSEEETTVEETSEEVTTVEETSEEVSTVETPDPIEVFGLGITRQNEAAIAFSWGQSLDQIDLGQSYNVYIDGEFYNNFAMAQEVEYTFATEGIHVIRVTAKLGDKETEGATVEYTFGNVTTVEETSEEVSTVEETSEEVTTVEETSEEVSTVEETSEEVSTVEETSEEVSTVEETSTEEVTTAEETSTEEVTTVEETSTEEVSTVEETSTEEVSTVEETSAVDTTTVAPTTQAPTTAAPTTVAPTTKAEVKAPGKASVKSAKRAKSKKKVKITINKLKGAVGYEIQLSKSKKFSKKTKVGKSVFTKKLTKTIKKLKVTKKLYVRVRAYVLDAKGEKVYGAWSKVKKAK
ncbi:MAG: discoidin domain-containing protein [Lachnospiraceae bacterium]|nr:discoidin domain-containing protein [Lachnospiraceae bacterium]